MSSRSSASEPVIVDVLRSPIGRAHKGALVDVRPDDLAAHVVRELLARNPGIEPASVGDVLCGCAFPWGEQGYNVGRSISLLAGLPHHVPAQTITRLCASSLQAARSAAHTIAVGEADLLLAVGVESVSRVGRGLELAQNNPRLDPEGDGDTIAAVFMPMGLTAELVADDFGITREQMDRYAQRSQQLATRARDEGLTAAELVTVPLPGGGAVTVDESIRPSTTVETLAALQPVFRAGGRVTAGNSCTLNDGAAAALMASGATARTLGLEPVARVVSSAVSAVDPSRMGIGPIDAIGRALGAAGLTVDDLDVIELNEAFAAQVIPVLHEVGLDPFDDRVNPLGGAIAIGHPFGMTGLRMISTLLNGLRHRDGTFGMVTMCVGGGQGQAMVLERLG